MMKKFNFHFGAAASAWMLVILVIAAELAEPFKNLLKSGFVPSLGRQSSNYVFDICYHGTIDAE